MKISSPGVRARGTPLNTDGTNTNSLPSSSMYLKHDRGEEMRGSRPKEGVQGAAFVYAYDGRSGGATHPDGFVANASWFMRSMYGAMPTPS
jgi:hypothetical protein